MQGWLLTEPTWPTWSTGTGATAQRSRALFDLLADEAYYSRPIALRHPIVFYEGHLPAFSFNTLVKKGARPAEHRRAARDALRARHRSARERGACRPAGGGAAGRRATSCARSRTKPTVRCSTRSSTPTSIGRASAARPRRSGVRDPRARGDAPGDAAVHVASPAVRRRSARRPAIGRASTARRRAQEWIDVPGRPRDARRRPRGRFRSAGTTSSRRSRVDVPAFAIERHNVTNARFLEFVDAGGYRDARWWRPEDWAWVQRERVDASAVLGARRRRLVLARHVRAAAAAAGVAGLRQPGRGVGVRALARRAPADRSGVPARGVRVAGRRAPASVGSGRADRRRTASSISRAGIRSRPAASSGRERVGRRGSRRQRLGMDEHAVRAVSRASARWRRTRSTRPTSSTASTS